MTHENELMAVARMNGFDVVQQFGAVRHGQRGIAASRSSALPAAIRCAAGCGAATASVSSTADGDEATVAFLRDEGWQVVNGEWTCQRDLPEDRKALPGAMGRRPNPHCTKCGDTRGGAYGHDTSECMWVAA